MRSLLIKPIIVLLIPGASFTSSSNLNMKIKNAYSSDVANTLYLKFCQSREDLSMHAIISKKRAT